MLGSQKQKNNAKTQMSNQCQIIKLKADSKKQWAGKRGSEELRADSSGMGAESWFKK
jgi:hypothetical protein